MKTLHGFFYGTQAKMGRTLRDILLLTFWLFWVPGVAFTAEEIQEDFMLEETTVTATKTGETNLQVTPIAITAIDEAFLKNKKAFSLMDLTQFTPNAEFTERGNGWNTIYVRGVGNSNPIVLSESAVAMYIDGVYVERGLSGGNSFFDIERIEVLRGPQGTLYGRNATGGAVNIVTKAPSDELEIKAGVEIGSFSKRRFDASVSGPLIGDTVKGRITLSDSEADGYQENLVGKDMADENFTGVRGAIEFAPTDSIDILLRGDYFDSVTGSWATKHLGIEGSALVSAGYTAPDDFYESRIDADHFTDVTDSGFSGHVKINLPRGMTLRSITGYRKRELDNKYDPDSTDLNLGSILYDTKIESFSQELQLNGTWRRLNFLLGAYYYRMEEDSDTSADLSYIFPGLTFEGRGDIDTDSYALFGRAGYQITDKLWAHADLRYSFEEKGGFSNASFSIPILPSRQKGFSGEWDAITPKFGLDYRLTEDVFFYLSAAKGFRSGVLAPNNIAPIPPFADPEFIWSYEVGAKTQWFDNRLRVNLSAFYSDYTDQQVMVMVFGIGNLVNAADSNIYGVELEFLARPLPALTINSAFSYLDAGFDEYQSVDVIGNPIDASGNRMPQSPEFKFSLGAQYVFTLAEYGFLTCRGDMAWSDDKYLDHLETPLTEVKAHTLFNGLVRFETREGNWSVEVYGKNLSDQETFLDLDIGPQGPLDVFGSPAPPRTFGVQLVYNY
ncbi:MAG: TonB-dependent receptor [Deltaproteobacteria bacterium]|nr:TonB-dependent receptor [Deltaproteobacteria bacterium]